MIINKITDFELSFDKALSKKSTYLVIVFLVAISLASRPIPWAKDALNYLNYVVYSDVLLDNTITKSFSNPLFFLVNEPFWLFINHLLGSIVQPEMVLRIVIFFSTFLVLLSLGKLTNYSLWTVFFFFIVSQILKNHITHLRQGLALGIFLFGLVIKGRTGLVLRMLSPFVHTSFWFMLFLEFFEQVARKIRLSISVKLLLFAVLTFAIILSLPFIVEIFGDRRFSEYEFRMAQSASFLGFMWWIVLGTLFFLGTRKNKISTLSTYGIVFYLVSYFFLDFGARLFENVVPLILAVMLTSTKEFKFVFGMLMLLYGALGWYFRGGISF